MEKGKFIQERIENLVEVEQKMQRTSWITTKLSAIPSILFIGISGGLAAGNVTKDDDIDLVIIVKKNTLFLSRFLILLVLEIWGVRRLRNQKHAADTICVNLLFDETALGWFARNNDVYTAREIGQMIPLFQRKETYETFLSANIWIQDFLPNIHASSSSKPRAIQGQDRDTGKAITLFRLLFFNPFFEFLSQQVQLSFMKRHRTNEIIENNLLAFHPNDYRIKTLRLLRLKMRQFGLLTKI